MEKIKFDFYIDTHNFIIIFFFLIIVLGPNSNKIFLIFKKIDFLFSMRVTAVVAIVAATRLMYPRLC